MKSLSRTIGSFWNSSIGKKILVALTGIALLLFLPAHLAGNLLVFVGPDALNEYGVWLHELGPGTAIWFARLGLLSAFIIHLVLTVQLTAANRAGCCSMADGAHSAALAALAGTPRAAGSTW